MGDDVPETREEYAARVAEAKHEHEQGDKRVVAMFPATMSFAVEALKAPALINGGSAAAMLAFIGTGRQAVTLNTILGLRLFGFGLLAAALATGVSWASQQCYLSSSKRADRIWVHPYVVDKKWLRWLGHIARLLAVLLVLAAYVLAGFAMWAVSSSIVPTPATPAPAPISSK